MNIFPEQPDRISDDLEPTAEELAAVEAPLPEWDLLRVRRFYDRLIAEELRVGALEAVEAAGEGLPVRRTSSGAVLRLVRGRAAGSGEGFVGGEAA
ncbi:hypothetical protein SAMN04487905_101211 [Actinopolyspora xinjiangensis]|uniref:Uncharacterized protein n=1 Tax=Actinopolyspora xinjiangensis TaxID=405564 RepID=A0A1H0NQV8_9ACTN|nr:hypothetical protein [Actinopolyspora xinjiangensis]SDO94730.1 hypothetical protein SAMN04487905_101211 [Actinopolyspora xinjiangensis]